MIIRFRFPFLYVTLFALWLTGCALAPTPAANTPDAVTPMVATSEVTPAPVATIEVLGVITVPNDTIAFETPVGGLSAIAYDHSQHAYYFLSDDRATLGPVRIYQAAIDLDDGTLDAGDLTWTGLIPLLNEQGAPFVRGALDPEGLVVSGDKFYVSTEGNVAALPPIAPAILEFTLTGEFVASLPLPEKIVPLTDGSRGVRDNKGLESLTLTPNGRTLISGVESALAQDGPAATLEESSLARLFTVDLASQRVVTEMVYPVEPIPVAPTPDTGQADNGLVELIALDDQGTLLAMERSYAEGVGNTVRLFLTRPQSSTNVSDLESLNNANIVTLYKERIAGFGRLGSALEIKPDNLEGMTLGPMLPDGRQLLLVVSDNNFNPSQTTQLWALALTISP